MGDVMKQIPHFHELFDGKAYYYSKYRGQYSHKLIDIVAETCRLDGEGRLLDLGCGTGKLTFPLAGYFREAIGIDISQDMLQSAQSQSDLLGIKKLKWVKMSWEAIGPEMGGFRLITAGDAFHWMDREKVLGLCYDRLAPGGAVALVGQGHMLGSRSLSWQRAVQSVVDEWFGGEARDHKNADVSDVQVLKNSAFQRTLTGHISSTRKRDIQSIIGYLYSTSTCSKSLLGSQTTAFERDVHDALNDVDPSGVFEEPVTDYYIIAFKEK